VFEPAHCTPRDLNALAYREVDGVVCNNDVAALAEGWDDTRDGGEGLCVDDACRDAQVCSDVLLCLHVYVLRAIEAGRAARADAVGAERLDSFLLERLVCDEVVEVQRGEIGDGAAVGELRLGAGRSAPMSASLRARTFQFQGTVPHNHRSLLIVKLFEGCGCSYQWLGRPFFNELVNLLYFVSLEPGPLLLLV